MHGAAADPLPLPSRAAPQIWKDAFVTKAKSPYMSHELPGKQVHDVRFRPYDDILAIGHDQGVFSMVRYTAPAHHPRLSSRALAPGDSGNRPLLPASSRRLCPALVSPTTTHWKPTRTRPRSSGVKARCTSCWTR